jgi:[ribosomal protein S18]-alanine N-acetyltransferase
MTILPVTCLAQLKEQYPMLRRYTPTDYTRCLEILDSNTPRFFSEQDRMNFLSFLTTPIDSYSVLEDIPGHIVGCGGVSTSDNDTIGTLTWGMIHVDYHHQGWGSFLTINRLFYLSTIPSVKKVTLHTSQETVEFYKKFGFQIISFIPDFYRKGLHRYDMEMLIDEHFNQNIAQMKARYNT